MLEFEAIYPKYDRLVRATLRRYGVRPADLDDLAQEAFVAIHRKLPEFEGRSSVETWLHSVCWRIAAAYRRRAHIQRETALAADGPCDVTPSAGEVPSVERLHAALESLPEQERELLALADAGGLSISAVAELTESRRETVSERLKRARLALQRGLGAPAAKCEGAVACGDGPMPGGRGVLVETDDSLDYIDDDCCICIHGAKTFVLWRGRSEAFHLRILLEGMRKSKQRYAGKMTYLCIVEATTTPPDRAARKMNAEILARVGDSVCGAAFAVERKPESKLVPAVLNSAVFLTRSPIPIRYFKDLAGAAAWLGPRCAGETAASLIAQMNAMRARLGARTN